MRRLLGYIPWTRWWDTRRFMKAITDISPLDTPFMQPSRKLTMKTFVDEMKRQMESDEPPSMYVVSPQDYETMKRVVLGEEE